ncbi:hypothetical protein [Roseinatronobacter monicus]|nr:hypothetical protein [Roseinatronobacter monicus]
MHDTVFDDPKNMALAGAIRSAGGQTLPNLWRILHDNMFLKLRFGMIDTPSGDGSTLRMIADSEAE